VVLIGRRPGLVVLEEPSPLPYCIHRSRSQYGIRIVSGAEEHVAEERGSGKSGELNFVAQTRETFYMLDSLT
jgi:hypothetical protein